MNKLILALQILATYDPTYCFIHGAIIVHVEFDLVSEIDRENLFNLGFEYETGMGWYNYE